MNWLQDSLPEAVHSAFDRLLLKKMTYEVAVKGSVLNSSPLDVTVMKELCEQLQVKGFWFEFRSFRCHCN